MQRRVIKLIKSVWTYWTPDEQLDLSDSDDDDATQSVEQPHQRPAIQTQNRHAFEALNRNNNTTVNDSPIASPAPPAPLAPAPEVAPPATTSTPSMTQELARQFATWFFQQLNGLNPQMAQEGTAVDWGPQHFFNDCKMNLNVQSHDSRMDSFQGAELVSEQFRNLVQSEGLLFNPHLDVGSTKGVHDQQGLVLVFVCGTIHREGLYLGTFEQRFGLVQDPLNQDTWKIKFTDMNVKSDQPVSQLPQLGSTSNCPVIQELKNEPLEACPSRLKRSILHCKESAAKSGGGGGPNQPAKRPCTEDSLLLTPGKQLEERRQAKEKRCEEERIAELQKELQAAEKRKHEEAARLQAVEKQKAEAAAAAARLQAEEKRKAEAAARLAEQRRIAEVKRIAEEEKRKAEEKRKEEQRRIAEQKQREEMEKQRRLLEEKLALEIKHKEEQHKKLVEEQQRIAKEREELKLEVQKRIATVREAAVKAANEAAKLKDLEEQREMLAKQIAQVEGEDTGGSEHESGELPNSNGHDTHKTSRSHKDRDGKERHSREHGRHHHRHKHKEARLAKQRRIAEVKRIAEEEKRKAEEKRKEEQMRIAEQKQQEELEKQRRLLEEKLALEIKQKEEQHRKQVEEQQRIAKEREEHKLEVQKRIATEREAAVKAATELYIGSKLKEIEGERGIIAKQLAAQAKGKQTGGSEHQSGELPNPNSYNTYEKSWLHKDHDGKERHSREHGHHLQHKQKEHRHPDSLKHEHGSPCGIILKLDLNKMQATQSSIRFKVDLNKMQATQLDDSSEEQRRKASEEKRKAERIAEKKRIAEEYSRKAEEKMKKEQRRMIALQRIAKEMEEHKLAEQKRIATEREAALKAAKKYLEEQKEMLAKQIAQAEDEETDGSEHESDELPNLSSHDTHKMSGSHKVGDGTTRCSRKHGHHHQQKHKENRHCDSPRHKHSDSREHSVERGVSSLTGRLKLKIKIGGKVVTPDPEESSASTSKSKEKN